jgi:curli biogenesis system outer membrane secretion channel CsgG
MRSLALVLLLSLAVTAPAAAQAQASAAKGPKIRMAVMEPEWDEGVIQSGWSFGGNAPSVYVRERQTFAQGMNEMMIAELLKTGRFIVVERKALDDVLAEQQLQHSGAGNPETASKVGRVIGAQYLIRPTITEFSYGEEAKTQGGAVKPPVDVPVVGRPKLGGGKAKITARLVLDTRIYEVETSQITTSVKSEATADQSMTKLDLGTEVFDYNSANFSKTPLGAATRQAVADAVAKVVAELGNKPWQARVVTVRAGQVYVNVGQDSGLQVGDVLEVFRPGEELVDPETGIKLGQTETKVGQLKVTSIEEKFSIASPVGNFTCERNDIVRFASR